MCWGIQWGMMLVVGELSLFFTCDVFLNVKCVILKLWLGIEMSKLTDAFIT